MSKRTITHYFVQSQKEDSEPEIVHHSKNEESGEYFYKFMSRKKANKLIEAEKVIKPNYKFRVVKCSETYEVASWV